MSNTVTYPRPLCFNRQIFDLTRMFTKFLFYIIIYKMSERGLSERREQHRNDLARLHRDRLQRTILRLDMYKHIAGAALKEGPSIQNLRIIRAAIHLEGLISGAIIAPSLCYPDQSGERLVHDIAETGQWLAYDFNRPGALGRKYKKSPTPLRTEGKLSAFFVEEFMDNPADALTPTGTLNMTNPEHTSSTAPTNMEELAAEGLVVSTTYGEAYEAAGLYDQFSEDLSARNLEDQPVFSVTPKGNTLVKLTAVGGGPSGGTRDRLHEASLVPGISTV